ncbi:MAG: alpha/beta hydrolase [Burkholderiales bacterium]|nr:MAG: alpha/beta hydrolase [Burkholderiales bacterium]
MIEPRLRQVTCASPKGLHRLAYWEWLPGGSGAAPAVADAPTVICAHGLTRNGRDFDALAARLSQRWRVVCPDMIGRGRSDRVADPQLYVLPQYLADCVTLIARLDVQRVAWVGTSMGGLIGLLLAAMPGTPIGRLVLNDIGPAIDDAGRDRIAAYVGRDPSFATEAEGVAALRELMRDFGPHTDDQFRLLTRHYLVQRDGRWGFHYDPAIAVPFREQQGRASPDLWPFYDAIRCPTLITRGAQSDILSAATAAEMARRGPRARCIAFEGVGHAPTFIATDQIDAVERFLAEELS